MKLEKISVNTVTENEDKDIFSSLLIAAIEEIPVCASRFLYHPSISGEYWELDAYEEIGYRYELCLTPITDGQETTDEWKLLLDYISSYSQGTIKTHELTFWGNYGIKFKSIKSLNDLQKAYPWNHRNKTK